MLSIQKYFKDKFNIETDVFCYPFGKVNQKVYDLTKKIYKNAVTTNRSRYNINKHNPLLIPRIDMGKPISFTKLYLRDHERLLLKTFWNQIEVSYLFPNAQFFSFAFKVDWIWKPSELVEKYFLCV